MIIDAGHGIDTPGKRSPDGLFREYFWNREVADKLLINLISNGISAVLLVTETNDVPLKTRVSRVNRICDRMGKQNVLLVSIHANAAGDGSRWMNAQGWSCYTSPGDTASDRAAECMYDAFESRFRDRKIRKDMSDGDRDWEASFTLLTKTRCPAILLENFFYDNQEECRWLLRNETKDRIAMAATRGIINYFRI